jgi:dipeptidyl aminopeptidase/acylaminoacyl peptidase
MKPAHLLVAAVLLVPAATFAQSPQLPQITPEAVQRAPDFDQMAREQAETDRLWRAASEGVMRMDKITYRSRADGLNIPAFVFQPLTLRGTNGHPALVWVHENIRGHLYEHYVPFVREAVSKGYVVIAPEYRGSIGYGQALYDAIDYGGAEVDDVVTAVEVLKTQYAHVDPLRIGIIGWSHGGMISLLSIFRHPKLFRAAATMVPVTNLFHRLAWKGVEKQRQAIDPQNRIGGPPWEEHEEYVRRSPLFHVDKLEIPLYVAVTRNDDDVNIEENMQLVDALRSRKPLLAETMIYDDPPGGHEFDRRVDAKTLEPENTREQRDSWNRVWTFLEWNLEPLRSLERRTQD